MYPEAFTERMKKMLGDAYDAFCRASAEPPVRALHANLYKVDPARLGALLCGAEPLPFAEDGFLFQSDERVGGEPLHHAGAYYMQEPAAMLPVIAAGITPGMRVLDACAAPGGKSTQLANRIGREGVLVSNEYVSARCVTLAGNLERMGIPNAVVLNTDTPTLAEVFPGYFDAAVADAPCSGEGMFRRDEIAVSEWSPENVRACAARQDEILDRVSRTVRAGGILVYSTCTYAPEENEGSVYRFLKSHPDYEITPVPDAVARVTEPAILLPGAEDTALAGKIALCARRHYVHTSPGEGQFLARMVRRKDTLPPEPNKKNARGGQAPSPLPDADRRVWDRFVSENLIPTATLPEPLLFKGGISLLGATVPTPEAITYARGVRAGTVEKGRVVPSHWLFSAYGHLFLRKLELSRDDPRLTAYLRGETVPCDLGGGWAVVTTEGIPLGGIKVVDGIAKNHYPKGIRLRG